jgi:hypothetical protein
MDSYWIMYNHVYYKGMSVGMIRLSSISIQRAKEEPWCLGLTIKEV